MHVEFATPGHLHGIMQIERETFGELGEAAMAPRELMADRIRRCNEIGDGWFLVALHEGEVAAYLVLQPTELLPEDCVSWDASTDGGTFKRTYDETGSTIFGVSLGAARSAPPGAASFLVHKALLLWIIRGKKRALFCSRMPSLGQAMVQRGVEPSTYCFEVDERGRPRDWLLAVFYDVLGVLPQRFLPNGYPPDGDSAGHGALIVLDDPFSALETSLSRVYQAGISFGQSLLKRSA